MKGFNRVLRRLGTLTSTDYSAYQVDTIARLTDVYNKYEEKYRGVRLRRTAPPNLSGKKGLLGMKFMMMIVMLVVVCILQLLL